MSNSERLQKVRERFEAIRARLPLQYDSDNLDFLADEYEAWSDLRKKANDEVLGEDQ